MEKATNNNDTGLLQDLLPADITSVFSARLPTEAQLWGIETEMAQKMAEKRYAEFIHGRHTARLALQQIGCPQVAIGKGKSREPLWPQHIVGSISHTLHYAAAAITVQNKYLGVGVDMEPSKQLEEKLFESICRPEELALFAQERLTPRQAGERAKLLFSIKESIYKCLWPSVKSFIDFTEMQIELNESEQSYKAIPHTHKVSADFVRRLEGRYKYHGELILSTAWIAA